MFHVKHAVRRYRSWRHTRFVRQWRPDIEEGRYWTAALRGEDPRATAFGQRVDALAASWARGESDESR